MRYFKVLIFLFFIQLSHSYAQNLKIQEINLSNNVLENEIINFIDNKKQEYTNFNDFGYIKVTLDYYNSQANQKELSHIFSIKDQYIPLKTEANYPLFFTYIDDKIVLLYTNEFRLINEIKFSKRSKRKLEKKVNKSLGKTEHVIAYNSKGEKVIDDKDFNPNESFNIHGGIKLKIYGDNTVEIIKTSSNN
ncbi:hypothetical protein [uncultured Salegentibacter sp.]|uniref:hypothetical protein n=1 Tax=uncultured Salegentibacter sp. TaxID=259320 RepID=UPI0025916DF2|nr:hypothetical protein [uncultured Salegentibacter sp.]